jgi:hypothetical protein
MRRFHDAHDKNHITEAQHHQYQSNDHAQYDDMQFDRNVHQRIINLQHIEEAQYHNLQLAESSDMQKGLQCSLRMR